MNRLEVSRQLVDVAAAIAALLLPVSLFASGEPSPYAAVPGRPRIWDETRRMY
jgi:hypothetical protein